MRSLLFVAAIAVAAAVGIRSSPSIGQDNVDQQFGTVHFATSCNETAQRRFDRAMRYQHSFWYKASKEIECNMHPADEDHAYPLTFITLERRNAPQAPRHH